MKEIFNKITTSVLVSSIAAFIIGLVMVIVPNISIQVIGIMVGIYMIVHGIMIISMDFIVNNIYTPFYGIMSGVLSIIAGILLIAMPGILATIFVIALGIWIILSSINMISVAISTKKTVSNWWLYMLLGIVDLICGIIILFNPFASSISVAIVAGVIIMIHSVINIIDMIVIKKNAKEVAKAFEANFKPAK